MPVAGNRTVAWLRAVASGVAAGLILAGVAVQTPADAAGPCDPPVASVIACENSLPGTPQSQWEVVGAGDPTIQGFATAMSVNVGETIAFKVKTSARAYTLDILRMGYYQGHGARMVQAGVLPTATLPQSQPNCLTDATTGLIDCGNWATSASWSVPATAVSGVYLAHLVRADTGGESLIPFVVRNDAAHSDLLFQTSDSTWQAYNSYGGNSLYECNVACPPGNPGGYKAAYAVSYNRPFHSAEDDLGRSWLTYAEYPMIRFLEANGYDVGYTSAIDVATRGALLNNHRVFLSVGHDEYWSADQRANVDAARDQGLGLAFFSGNEMFWKTRWQSSIAGPATPGRTLVTYKETHFDAPVDPQGPAMWTGTWRDPRFSPPGDARPENATTGQYFLVNSGTTDIKVPAQYASLRLWRNTAVASLPAGQTLTLGAGVGTLGYEWDIAANNGFQPPGLMKLSSTTATAEAFIDYGTTVMQGRSATHNLTLYRAASGALVFGAGTVQWSWGLDGVQTGKPVDRNMQQATVNLFADQGVQPFTLMSGLTAATKSIDISAPSSTVTTPAAGASILDGTSVIISGTAADSGGGVVAGVEVSTDAGATWQPAVGTSNWSFTWIAHGSPTSTIRTRAVDDSGNLETTGSGVPVTVACPCSVWGPNVTPAGIDSGDGNSVEVGMQFRSDAAGYITGLRFYKASANTGTHIGNLWTANGQSLARVTFAGESASGWQQASLSSPVAITAGTTYVVSYFAPVGHYSQEAGSMYLHPAPQPAGNNNLDPTPLHVLRNTLGTPNGLYSYSGSTTFPVNTYHGENYFVDVVYAPEAQATPTVPAAPTTVTAVAGNASATISWTAPSNGGSALTGYTVTPYLGTQAQAATTVTGAPPATSTTITGLTNGSAYTFKVAATNAVGTGPQSSASNAVTPTAPITPTAPAAPTNVTATAGNASAALTWTAPPNGGSTITKYTVTRYVDGVANGTTTSAGSPPASALTITGLTNGTTYTFTVTAENAVGTGPASALSNAVTPTTPAVPGAPTNVTATAGNKSATVSWTAPPAGSSPITGYTITTYVGSTVQKTTPVNGSPPPTSRTITGLKNGTTYTFRVTATNAAGTGPQSSPSNAVTPPQ